MVEAIRAWVVVDDDDCPMGFYWNSGGAADHVVRAVGRHLRVVPMVDARLGDRIRGMADEFLARPAGARATVVMMVECLRELVVGPKTKWDLACALDAAAGLLRALDGRPSHEVEKAAAEKEQVVWLGPYESGKKPAP